MNDETCLIGEISDDFDRVAVGVTDAIAVESAVGIGVLDERMAPTELAPKNLSYPAAMVDGLDDRSRHIPEPSVEAVK